MKLGLLLIFTFFNEYYTLSDKISWLYLWRKMSSAMVSTAVEVPTSVKLYPVL